MERERRGSDGRERETEGVGFSRRVKSGERRGEERQDINKTAAFASLSVLSKAKCE